LADMQIWLADPLLGGTAQGGRHLIELLAAFGLTTLIGLERTIQGKVAGLRTQTIVGTSSALILLISKYGFGDVLTAQTVALDPSRVAAQIVSGIGFLGAGIIITRRGAVHGLTTAAAVWESAAIGMAAGAGLLLLAGAVVALHFVSALAFNVVERELTASCAERSGCTSSTKAAGVCYGKYCRLAGSENGSSTNSTRTPMTSSAIRLA
jgi:putative Mg2+ transporter-C (MgtC) family protein